MARLIQTVNTSEFSSPSPDPSGIIFIGDSNTFLISDSEVNENLVFQGDNLYEVNLNGNLVNTGNVLAISSEPTGLGYNPNNGNIFISDDTGTSRRIYQVDSGNDNTFGTSDDIEVSNFRTIPFGSNDAEDVAYSTSSGNLFVSDGFDSVIYEVTTNGTLISSFSTSNFGLSDPEGIGFDAQSGNLFIVGEPINTVFEVSTSGILVQTIDISAANPIQPAGIEIAPSSDGSGQSIYIVDRGIDERDDINENDGRFYEFSLNGDDPDPGVNPEISIADASIVEGDNGNNNLDITVSLSQASTEAVTVDFTTVDDTAVAGEDYLASSGTVTFAPGQTSQTITLSVIGDTVVEEPEVETFLVNLSNASGATILDGEATGTITDNDNDGNPGGGSNEAFYATTRDSVNLNGNTFDDEDVILYNPNTQTWSLYVDGSDIGLSTRDIDGLHVNSDGSVLLSVNQDGNIEGIGNVDDADILRFNPTSTGSDTAGSLELYFDGSDVGLDTNEEDIDGISIASNGDILISTNGSYNINGLAGDDEDILAFSATSLGSNTAGSFSLYVDGSDIDLGDSSEDIKGLSALSSGELVLSTLGGFNVTGLTGSGSDLFSFNPSSLGDNTSGSFDLLSDGASNGLGNQVVADISII